MNLATLIVSSVSIIFNLVFFAIVAWQRKPGDGLTKLDMFTLFAISVLPIICLFTTIVHCARSIMNVTDNIKARKN